MSTIFANQKQELLCVLDFYQISNHGKQYQRFPSKLIRQSSSDESKKDHGNSRDPLRIHFKIVGLDLNLLS